VQKENKKQGMSAGKIAEYAGVAAAFAFVAFGVMADLQMLPDGGMLEQKRDVYIVDSPKIETEKGTLADYTVLYTLPLDESGSDAEPGKASLTGYYNETGQGAIRPGLYRITTRRNGVALFGIGHMAVIKADRLV